MCFCYNNVRVPRISDDVYSLGIFRGLFIVIFVHIYKINQNLGVKRVSVSVYQLCQQNPSTCVGVSVINNTVQEN